MPPYRLVLFSSVAFPTPRSLPNRDLPRTGHPRFSNPQFPPDNSRQEFSFPSSVVQATNATPQQKKSSPLPRSSPSCGYAPPPLAGRRPSGLARMRTRSCAGAVSVENWLPISTSARRWYRRRESSKARGRELGAGGELVGELSPARIRRDRPPEATVPHEEAGSLKMLYGKCFCHPWGARLRPSSWQAAGRDAGETTRNCRSLSGTARWHRRGRRQHGDATLS
jgi:hypothetical protein